MQKPYAELFGYVLIVFVRHFIHVYLCSSRKSLPVAALGNLLVRQAGHWGCCSLAQLVA